MNRLYIYENNRSVTAYWILPDFLQTSKVQWNKHSYYHPDTEIYIGRAPCMKRSNHNAVQNTIMIALQDAHMMVRMLRRPKRKKRKRKEHAPTEYLQRSLFGEE